MKEIVKLPKTAKRVMTFVSDPYKKAMYKKVMLDAESTAQRMAKMKGRDKEESQK